MLSGDRPSFGGGEKLLLKLEAHRLYSGRRRTALHLDVLKGYKC